MRGKFLKLMALAAVTAMIAGMGVARADVITNNMDSTIDSSVENRSLAKDATTTVALMGNNANALSGSTYPDENGCANWGGGKFLEATLVNSHSSVASVTGWTTSPALMMPPNVLRFQGFNGQPNGVCTNTITLTIKGLSPGTATFSLTRNSSSTVENVYLNPATFSITVPAPTNTAPSVSVTGVTHNATYELGAVPSAGCLVSDTEDSLTSSTTATSPTGAGSTVGQHTATCSYTDGGQITRTATATYTVQDTTGPTIDCTPTAADANWHATERSFSCTASDLSGLADSTQATFNLTTSVGAGNEDGDASTNSVTVLDTLGNESTASAITGNKVDRKAPSVSCDSADSAWHSTDQSSACTASDGGSNLANPADASFNLSTSVPAGTETSNASTGSRTVNDAVGNSATAGPVSGFKIDKKAPTVSVTGVTNGATYTLGSVPTAGCSSTDGGSGMTGGQAQEATATTTGTIGSVTTSCSGAKDAIGNAASAAQVTFNVHYSWDGFFRPVDNKDASGNYILNVAKAGSSIPIKFTLGGDQGLGVISEAKAPSISCTNGATDEIETVASAGSSGLQYDSLTGTYTYVWKTDKAMAGTCRQLNLTLNDGTKHSAQFRMTK